MVRQYKKAHPKQEVSSLMFYEYGKGIPLDTIEVLQKAINSYNGKDITSNVNKIQNTYKKKDFNYYDKVYVVGYSGGGISAIRSVEALRDSHSIYVDKLITVGSPRIKVRDSETKKSIALYLKGDPIHVLFKFTRGNKKMPRKKLTGLKPPKKGRIAYFLLDCNQ